MVLWKIQTKKKTVYILSKIVPLYERECHKWNDSYETLGVYSSLKKAKAQQKEYFLYALTLPFEEMQYELSLSEGDHHTLAEHSVGGMFDDYLEEMLQLLGFLFPNKMLEVNNIYQKEFLGLEEQKELKEFQKDFDYQSFYDNHWEYHEKIFSFSNDSKNVFETICNMIDQSNIEDFVSNETEVFRIIGKIYDLVDDDEFEDKIFNISSYVLNANLLEEENGVDEN